MSTSPTSEPQKPPSKTHITVETALDLQRQALAIANGDVHRVAITAATGFVDAFCQCYTPESTSTVFVVVGAGLNGLIGLHAARMLHAMPAYDAAVYSPTSVNDHTDVATFCKTHGIGHFEFVPSTLPFYFDVIVDALLGVGFDGGDIRPHMWPIFEVLVSAQLPVASVDVPSGWDLSLGPREVDRTADSFVKPNLLVSLAAPKLCALQFAGAYHFVAGRHVPRDLLEARGLELPSYPGKQAHSVMLSSNERAFGAQNGEVYGKPGLYNATLFTKNERRRYVDIDDDMDLWDELD